MPVAHTAQELDLVLLYLLAPAPAIALLPAHQVPVDILGDKSQARRNPMYQSNLRGSVRLPRCRKTKFHRPRVRPL